MHNRVNSNLIHFNKCEIFSHLLTLSYRHVTIFLKEWQAHKKRIRKGR
ncbi:hypothetical protein CLOSYM_05003 [[Clostridium] symbiosum ATCC 14940]|uniref:Uncharacterized protein n=1 Tax=[Clostridium] symbiosum ATCC 14940 TaxID=411472 RepID=A0ABC9TNW1_CLOSY|nr:hypothetical protein CLOSYM_05003 [[Clostridium] symbiosum ATCC 14940]